MRIVKTALLLVLLAVQPDRAVAQLPAAGRGDVFHVVSVTQLANGGRDVKLRNPHTGYVHSVTIYVELDIRVKDVFTERRDGGRIVLTLVSRPGGNVPTAPAPRVDPADVQRAAQVFWKFITTPPSENGVDDVMSGFLQGLGHVVKPAEMRGNSNYNKGYFVGALINVGLNLATVVKTPTKVRLPPRGRWTPNQANILLTGSHGEVHVPPTGATPGEVRAFAQARPGKVSNTTWMSRAEGLEDLRHALQAEHATIDAMRPGEVTPFVVDLPRPRAGLESMNGGIPRQATIRRVSMVIQKTLDGKGIQLLHFMPQE